jgi:hypothetical protein
MEKMKDDFLKDFPWIDTLITSMGWFWRIVQAGRVLLKCKKPPLVGCLGLLKDAVTDNELNCILCIPWVQKEIGKIVMAVPWFKNMPAELGNLILKTMQDVVPEDAKILKEIFSERIPIEAPDIEDIATECDAKCDGFPLFEGGDSGSGISRGEGGKAQEVAQFREKLSKEQLEKLLNEANKKGMLDKPFDLKQVEELMQEMENKDSEKSNKGKESKSQGQEQSGEKGESKEGKSEGGSSSGSGPCTWEPYMLGVSTFVDDQLTPSNSDWGAANGHTTRSFSKSFDSKACSVNLVIQNNFDIAGLGTDCKRPAGFASPVVTTEIIYNGEVLFKKTDKSPVPATTKNDYRVTPNWGNRISLTPISESGELTIKMTLFDPDTKTTRVFEGTIKIDVNPPPEACCNCIS